VVNVCTSYWPRICGQPEFEIYRLLMTSPRQTIHCGPILTLEHMNPGTSMLVWSSWPVLASSSSSSSNLLRSHFRFCNRILALFEFLPHFPVFTYSFECRILSLIRSLSKCIPFIPLVLYRCMINYPKGVCPGSRALYVFVNK